MSSLILKGWASFPDRKERRKGYRGGSNWLIPSANQNTKRRRIPLLDTDVHRNVTSHGRRTMMSLGRHLYCAYDVVRGAVNELTEAATSSFLLQSRSKNSGFKTAVEAWTSRHDRYCDIAGPPYTMRTYRSSLARAIYVDGDIGSIYVRDPDGIPCLQVIPGHRIGSDGTQQYVEGGPYDGAEIIDGVIVGPGMRPLAYRVLVGDILDYENFVDVPASAMRLSFIPLFPGQVRGFSMIGFSAWNWQDLSEAKRFELLAQKAGAARVFQEWNEAGEPPPGADHVVGPNSGDPTNGTPSGLWYETIDEGLNQYFRSSDPNARLEAVKFDRPSANQQAYTEQSIREGLYAAGWSIDYGLLPIKIGGAPLRVLVDKLNATISGLLETVIEPAARRFDAFRIPVAMLEMKRIPFAEDWWNWEYQAAAKLTADRKYDSDVTIQEVKFGIRSRESGAMERGETHDDILVSNGRSVRRLYAEAQAISKEFGRPFEEVLDRLEQMTPNGMPAPAASEPAKATEPTE